MNPYLNTKKKKKKKIEARKSSSSVSCNKTEHKRNN